MDRAIRNVGSLDDVKHRETETPKRTKRNEVQGHTDKKTDIALISAFGGMPTQKLDPHQKAPHPLTQIHVDKPRRKNHKKYQDEDDDQKNSRIFDEYFPEDVSRVKCLFDLLMCQLLRCYNNALFLCTLIFCTHTSVYSSPKENSKN